MSIFGNLNSSEPLGPIWTGAFVDVQVKDEDGQDYSLYILADKANNYLRDAGKPMSFYYLLDQPRLARDADDHFMFHLQEFGGVMDPDRNIGIDDELELSGGYLTFTTTLKVPEQVMLSAISKLKQKLSTQYADHHLLGWNPSFKEPNIAPIPIVDNVTSVHKVTILDEEDEKVDESGNVNGWLFDVQGEGRGSLNPIGTNAFSTMMGGLTTQLIRGSSRSGTSSIVIENKIRSKVWSMVREMWIRGQWLDIYNHFESKIEAKSTFSRVDVGLEVEALIRTGAINVMVRFDDEFVTVEEKENMDKAKDAIVASFVELAKKTIFDKEHQTETEASGKRKFVFVLKNRTDITFLKLDYRETVDKMVVKESVQSATLEGLFDELANDPSAEARYFSRVHFEEGFQKLHIIIGARQFNWIGENGEPGDPISSVAVQVGYPDSQGNLIWKNSARYKTENEDALSSKSTLASWTRETRNRQYIFEFTRHNAQNGNADKIYIKKKIYFKEAPNVFVEEIEGESFSNEHALELGTESLNKLSIGPIVLPFKLPGQVHCVASFKIGGLRDRTLKVSDDDQYLEFWYPDSVELPNWKYKIAMTVHGKRFWDPSISYESKWQNGDANGFLSMELPDVPEELLEKVQNYLS